mmetsp:Transcript_1056/g.2780  ORF Transcript_1056/g.2780 Transcript_1056/m.2780 type:complete len:186 (-) Transcript_1056:10-567(-)
MPFLTQWYAAFKFAPEILFGGQWDGVPIPTAAWAPTEQAQGWLLYALTVGLVIMRIYCGGSIWFTAIPFLVVSFIYYLCSQVSHINAESMRPVKSAQEWAALQIEHSQGDYECTSRAWSVISCGLNCQAIHHLFPGVHPCHYAALASLMRPVFEKHGLPTASWNKSYSDSIRYHLSHVHQRMLVE